MATPGSSDQSGTDRALDMARNELRHRLADSFQLVTSLIRLRLQRTESPESRDDLSWLLDIVTALGLLQQRLTTADNGAFAAYLADVGQFWRRVAGERARILVEAERFRVDEQRTATLALIAHELIRDAVERSGDGPVSIDVLLRRTHLAFVGGMTERTLREVAEAVSGPLGWDADRVDEVARGIVAAYARHGFNEPAFLDATPSAPAGRLV